MRRQTTYTFTLFPFPYTTSSLYTLVFLLNYTVYISNFFFSLSLSLRRKTGQILPILGRWIDWRPVVHTLCGGSQVRLAAIQATFGRQTQVRKRQPRHVVNRPERVRR